MQAGIGCLRASQDSCLSGWVNVSSICTWAPRATHPSKTEQTSARYVNSFQHEKSKRRSEAILGFLEIRVRLGTPVRIQGARLWQRHYGGRP